MTAPNQPARPGGTEPSDPLNPVKLLVAWSIVGIPLAWGVWHVVLNALKLFK